MPHILLIDDDLGILASLQLLLKQNGYTSETATSQPEALKKLSVGHFHCIIQDMNFSRTTTGDDGLNLLKTIRQREPNLPILLLTAWGSIDLAVAGMKLGANDFLTKPWQNQRLISSLKTAIGLSESTETDFINRQELESKGDFSLIVGNNKQVLQILQLILRIAPTDAPVLITGESGTGKEGIAETIHRNSLRNKGSFHPLNMGSIPSNLFESELFGHIKGAFTDAITNRKGAFEAAFGGTLFLDEIGEMELNHQVKLLRVLQDGTYQPIGAGKSQLSNVRIISATNQDLQKRIQSGKFREDLFYRLNLIPIYLPPLRERTDDIPILVKHFLQVASKVYHKPHMSIQFNALDYLKKQPWKGNIRELRHTIERACLLSNDNEITIHHLQTTTIYSPDADLSVLEISERQMIESAIQNFQGNISKAAEHLGLSRAALYRRMEKFGLRGNE